MQNVVVTRAGPLPRRAVEQSGEPNIFLSAVIVMTRQMPTFRVIFIYQGKNGYYHVLEERS